MASAEEASKKRVLVFFADGSEELEATSVVNVLRRTKKVELQIAAVTAAESSAEVIGSRETRIVGDCLARSCVEQSFDLVVCPGGMPGAKTLGESEEVRSILLKTIEESATQTRLIAAICAAPAVVLAAVQTGSDSESLIKGRNVTGYPAKKFTDAISAAGANYVDDQAVVIDVQSDTPNLSVITSQGPGTAIQFGLTLAELLFDFDTAKKVANAMLVSYESCQSVEK